MAKMRLSDKEFWAILRESAGIYARTAAMIRSKYGIEYTRQAVKNRAEKKPEELKDIIEQDLDMAESGLHSLMYSKSEKIKLNAIQFYLKTKGRDRGYVERIENEVTVNPFNELMKKVAERRSNESNTGNS